MTQIVASKDSLVSELLAANPPPEGSYSDFHLEQRKDVKLQQICGYLENGLYRSVVRISRRSLVKVCIFRLLIMCYII